MNKKLSAILLALCLCAALPTPGVADEARGVEIVTNAKDAVDTYAIDQTLDLSAYLRACEITQGGAYRLTGALQGQIIINVPKDDKVYLLLDGVTVQNETAPALLVEQADKVTLTLAPGSENTLSDGAAYADTADGAPNAALYSREDLVINGSGALTVNGHYLDGIAGKDDILIVGGTVTVSAVDDGIRGKDSVVITGGSVHVTAGGDGLKATNETDQGKGYVAVSGGQTVIVAGGDGIDAATVAQVTGGSLSVTSGGGSTGARAQGEYGGFGGRGGWWDSDPWGGADEEETVSAKGIKGGTLAYIAGGDVTVDASDDALHSNGDVAVASGTLRLQSDDDGIHADGTASVSGGTVDIARCYEGIEGLKIAISGGYITLTASDDGLNAAGGNDQSGMMGWGRRDVFASSDGSEVSISGGTLIVNASGDGLDSNGNLYISGGETYVSGPTNSGNGALDYGGECVISGGVLAAVGAAGMAQAPGTGSTQCSLSVSLSGNAGDVVTLRSASGQTLLSFTAQSAFQHAVLSAPGLTVGENCMVMLNGAQAQSVTLTGTVTGAGGGMGGGRMGGGGRWGR